MIAPPRPCPLTFFAVLAAWPIYALAAAPALEAQDSADELRIREIRTESNEAIARQDVEGFLASLADDYRASASSGALLDSPQAMGEAFAGRFATSPDALYVRTPETVELSASEPVAAETGTWVGSWTTPEGPFRTGGRYLAYWSKETGEWLIHSELFVPLFCEGAGCGMEGPGGRHEVLPPRACHASALSCTPSLVTCARMPPGRAGWPTTKPA